MKVTWGVILSLAVVAVASMGACRIPDSGSAATPEPAPAPELVQPAPQPVAGWVVEADTYGVVGPDTYTVVCVPDGDLTLPPPERVTKKEFITDADTATNSQQGQPCPGGEPTRRFGGAG